VLFKSAALLLKLWNTSKVHIHQDEKQTDQLTQQINPYEAALATIRVPEGKSCWGESARTPAEKAMYLQETLYKKHNIEVPCSVLDQMVWLRISAQVF